MRCYKLKVVIDRFEGEYALVEDENKNIINMPKCLVPVNAKEGSVIKIELDEDETKRRNEDAKSLFDSIFKS